MAKLLIPPPSVEELLSYFAEWIARNTRSKVTIIMYKSKEEHSTTEYDARS